MLFPSLHFLNFFPIIPMGAIRYSCPIRLVPTYILPAKEIRLMENFQLDNRNIIFCIFKFINYNCKGIQTSACRS